MGFWVALGRCIGKGIGWLIRHPGVIDGGIQIVKGARKKKPELPEEAPLPEVDNTTTTSTDASGAHVMLPLGNIEESKP